MPETILNFFLSGVLATNKKTKNCRKVDRPQLPV